LKHALIGLDFATFISPIDPAIQPPDDDILSVTAGAVSRQRLHDLFLAAFSLAALEDSVRTIIGQRGATPIDISPDGATNEGGFAQVARSEGENVLFAQKETEQADLIKGAAKILSDRNGSLPNLDVFQAIIEFCQSQGIELTVFIPPSHAHLLDRIYDAGLGDAFEQWKAELAARVSGPSGRSVTIWDFSGYDAYSTEPIPAQGDRRTATQWFWEPAHFKRALGQKMLARMLTDQPSDFGVRLTQQNVAAHLAKSRRDRLAYHCVQQDEGSAPSDAPRTGPCTLAASAPHPQPPDRP
jgi:hypothetical protein